MGEKDVHEKIMPKKKKGNRRGNRIGGNYCRRKWTVSGNKNWVSPTSKSEKGDPGPIAHRLVQEEKERKKGVANRGGR